MKKLLHERLRELDCEQIFPLPNLKAMADEIEKYYIPRPRFEDGEPVYYSDKIEADGLIDTVDQICVLADKPDSDQVFFYLHGGVTLARSNSVSVKRPKPKVLDADGVEVKLGDTVYGTTSGKAYEVALLDPNDHCHACLRNEDGQHWHSCGGFTHKEPDSLEKLRDEIDSLRKQGAQIRRDVWGSWADRLTALIERGA